MSRTRLPLGIRSLSGGFAVTSSPLFKVAEFVDTETSGKNNSVSTATYARPMASGWTTV